MRCCCYCLLLVLLVPILTGCASGSEIAQPPTRLSEINRVLESSDATIVWVSGEKVRDAAHVRLSRDSIRYRLHTDPGGSGRWERPPLPDLNEKTRSRSIHDVQRVLAHVGGGGGLNGLAIGAAPGTFLFGLSIIEWFSMGCSGSADLTCLAPGLGLYVGAIGALLGGIIGGIVGEAQDKDLQVVYWSPVQRYLE
jgi:hypothetical protein